MTIREKFRPVKVSFLPIVPVIKTACSGADRRAISLLSPRLLLLLLRLLLLEEEPSGPISTASWR